MPNDLEERIAHLEQRLDQFEQEKLVQQRRARTWKAVRLGIFGLLAAVYGLYFHQMTSALI